MGCSTSKSNMVITISETGTQNDTSTESVKSGTPEDPSIQDALVLEYTPPRKLRPYRFEDHFWEHKKKLIPDYNRMKVLDQRAMKAPSSLTESPQKLVDYLTKDLTSELEKARVLIRWIGDNIAYDVEYLKTGVFGDYSIENVLRTGTAVCQGYSDLLEHFCRLAGIQCKVMSGLAKGAGYYPGKVLNTSNHAWNKVKIQNQWYLCDATWAAGSVGDNRFEKKWKESWFLTHPDAFLSSHLPFEINKGVLTSEQLVSKPVTSLDTWNNRVRSDPMPHVYNIQPITHPQSVIKVQSAELRIIYSNPYNHAMKQWTEFSPHRAEQKYSDRAMLYAVGKKVHVDVRLPGKGSYSLKIKGSLVTPEWPNEKKDNTQAHRLFWYKVEYKGSQGKEGFIPSGAGAEWGMTPHYQAAGFKLLSPESPVLQATNGTCQIQMQLPTRGVFPTFHRLHHPEVNTSQLKPCVYGEKEGNKATYHIRCPYPGEYRFEINYKPAPDSGNGGYRTGAAFLIMCQQPAQDAYIFTDCNYISGPMPAFYTTYGLRVSTLSSTVKATNGEAIIVIGKTKPVKVFAFLYSADGQRSYVDQRTTGRGTTFNIKLPGKGYHFFKLYASEKNEKSGSLVATYYVTW